MPARQKIGSSYVQRRKDGTFKKFTNAGRSVAADRRSRSKTVVKKGYGHQGDQVAEIRVIAKTRASAGKKARERLSDMYRIVGMSILERRKGGMKKWSVRYKKR